MKATNAVQVRLVLSMPFVGVLPNDDICDSNARWYSFQNKNAWSKINADAKKHNWELVNKEQWPKAAF